ncbi:MAG: hypothetical protein OMM_11470 [Candidatus Magnetoglobus multicellularis str. Araruama]|uniref:Uncharacterized protein n=1 Tax=Candidatus Magnetoglobus multicellularis str. Araruama TaxID=890399 RepID=A0A1V1NY76_9BACT|nr:MAG: hypothetical protein OMM_11470 [Candidatus Magnetoglobus multicellularis str. Araruama]
MITSAKGMNASSVPFELFGGKIVTASIKNTVIEALGHVIVQKEIIKSRIQSGGEIHIQNGNVLTSNLAALNFTVWSINQVNTHCRLCQKIVRPWFEKLN